MRYSVVILTHGDRLPALQRCLDKVVAGSRTPLEDYEIIVVNNGSEEIRAAGSWLLDHHIPLSVLHLATNEGVCARNHGIGAARGEFIIQVDDDVQVTPGFDDILLSPYDGRPSIGATGQHGFYQDSTWGLLIDDRRRPSPGQFADLVMGYCWSWRNVSGRCRAGCKDGYFETMRDERPYDDLCPTCDGTGLARFFYDWQFSPFWHEESDLQLQIRSAGYHIMVTPPVAVHHSLRGPHTQASEDLAGANFFKLVDKWSNQDVPFEGPTVGLVGPAPGRRPIRA